MTKGEILAGSFRPFISPGVKGTKEVIDEVIEGMAKSIDKAINEDELRMRIKQLLSSLEYEKLSPYQKDIIVLLEKDLNN